MLLQQQSTIMCVEDHYLETVDNDTWNTWHVGKIIDPHLTTHIFQARYVPDLYDLAHVTRWELQNLHDLGHVSWVGPV